MKLMRISAVAAIAMASAVLSIQSVEAQAPAVNDAEIAHIAVTANAIDIENAKSALVKIRSESVKQFAETMIRDHAGVNKMAGDLAAKLHVTPLDNAVSKSLREGQKAELAKVADLKGRAFEKAYVAHEIAYHQAVIDAVDSILVPQTSNAELKALLVGVRPALVAHLEHAKMVMKEMK
jgi:putative membrane protein